MLKSLVVKNAIGDCFAEVGSRKSGPWATEAEAVGKLILSDPPAFGFDLTTVRPGQTKNNGRRHKVVAFCGYGRAGKDESAKILARLTGLRYGGSLSWAGLPHMAQVLGLCPQEAWDTRHTRREEWKAHLDFYRKDDPSRLVRDLLGYADIVVGVRAGIELHHARHVDKLIDHAVWVHRPGTPADTTVTYTESDCDEVLVNAGNLKVLEATVLELADRLGLTTKIN
jgi:hypothetical protein